MYTLYRIPIKKLNPFLLQLAAADPFCLLMFLPLNTLGWHNDRICQNKSTWILSCHIQIYSDHGDRPTCYSIYNLKNMIHNIVIKNFLIEVG